jgi:hypothetical protein
VDGYFSLRQTREVVLFKAAHYIPKPLVELLQVPIIIPTSEPEDKYRVGELDYISVELRHAASHEPNAARVMPPVVHQVSDTFREWRRFRCNVFVCLIDDEHIRRTRRLAAKSAGSHQRGYRRIKLANRMAIIGHVTAIGFMFAQRVID